MPKIQILTSIVTKQTAAWIKMSLG